MSVVVVGVVVVVDVVVGETWYVLLWPDLR